MLVLLDEAKERTGARVRYKVGRGYAEGHILDVNETNKVVIKTAKGGKVVREPGPLVEVEVVRE